MYAAGIEWIFQDFTTILKNLFGNTARKLRMSYESVVKTTPNCMHVSKTNKKKIWNILDVPWDFPLRQVQKRPSSMLGHQLKI